MKRNVLVVAAHPDDEVLGCGATIARLVHHGWTAYSLILGEGVTSRDQERSRERRESEIQRLRKEAKEANRILGVKEVLLYDFPDNRFDTVPLLEMVKVIENVIQNVSPEIVFTHHRGDLNVDHRRVYEATMIACRPISGLAVKRIYSFEILSSTEWNYPRHFDPTMYIDVTDFIDVKLSAMQAYQLEIRSYPHPRSVDGIRIKAQSRGLEVGYQYAEAFEVVRQLVDQESVL